MCMEMKDKHTCNNKSSEREMQPKHKGIALKETPNTKTTTRVHRIWERDAQEIDRI